MLREEIRRGRERRREKETPGGGGPGEAGDDDDACVEDASDALTYLLPSRGWSLLTFSWRW